MNKTQAVAAAELLLDAKRSGEGLDYLPLAVRPASRADGYAVQDAMVSLMGGDVFGWKIAATSIAGQRHIGVDGPIAGRLMSNHVLSFGTAVPRVPNRMMVAEPEICFRMARDLPSRPAPYGREEIVDAVASVHPAFEIPDSRYRDYTKVGAEQLIADNACEHFFMVGPSGIDHWRQIDLVALSVRARVQGGSEQMGSGANVLGDPVTALVWLANELSVHGHQLSKGDYVTTGACVPPLQMTFGDAAQADFGVIGSIAVRFGA